MLFISTILNYFPSNSPISTFVEIYDLALGQFRNCLRSKDQTQKSALYFISLYNIHTPFSRQKLVPDTMGAIF